MMNLHRFLLQNFHYVSTSFQLRVFYYLFMKFAARWRPAASGSTACSRSGAAHRTTPEIATAVVVDDGASPAGPRCPRYVRRPCQVFHLLSRTAGPRLITFISGMHPRLVTSRAAIAGGWLAGWTGVRGAGVLQPYISGVVSSCCRSVLVPCCSKFS